MNRIIQHRPAYFSGFENEEHEFETISELLNIDFVKNFSDSKDFYKYSFEPDRLYLVAEYKEGKEWWVVGRLDKPVELPAWEPVYEIKENVCLGK